MDDKDFEAYLEKVGEARKAIVEDIKAKGKLGKNCGGEIACPVCEKGKLAYRYAGAYNGHIHAACGTDGCVQWME